MSYFVRGPQISGSVSLFSELSFPKAPSPSCSGGGGAMLAENFSVSRILLNCPVYTVAHFPLTISESRAPSTHHLLRMYLQSFTEMKVVSVLLGLGMICIPLTAF